MRKLLRRFRREQRGAVLVIVAVAMVGMIGMAALAIDAGSWYQVQRRAQSAADAAALAGAQDLPASESAATTDADSYVSKNFSSAPTPTVTFPTSSSIKVVVAVTAPSFFKVFGFNSANVSATSVAAETAPTTACAIGNACDAVFAADSSCTADGFTAGGGTTITGGVHSNGSVNAGGGGSAFGPTTYGNGTSCVITGSATYTSGPTQEAPISIPPATNWPINYTTDFPPCTAGSTCTGACDVTTTPCPTANKTPSFCTQSFSAAVTLVSYYPDTLASGNIYCDVGTGTASTPSTWNGAITADQSGSAIYASFVAGSLTLGGGDILDACGYAASGYAVSRCSAAVPAPATANYPVAYTLGTGTAITNASGGGTYLGDFFAPNGTIVMGGGDSTTFLEAQDVSVSSGGFTGDGPSDSGGGGGSSGSEALLQ